MLPLMKTCHLQLPLQPPGFWAQTVKLLRLQPQQNLPPLQLIALLELRRQPPEAPSQPLFRTVAHLQRVQQDSPTVSI